MTWLLRTRMLKAARRGLRAHSRARPAQRLSLTLPVLPVTEQRLVLRPNAHCSDRLPTAAAAEVHVVTARIEVEVPRAVRVARVERTRPIVAVAACAVEIAIEAVASGGQEETVAIRSGEESSAHAVLGRPSGGRVVVELQPFLHGRHAPVWSPIGRGGVVIGQQGGQVIGEAIVAVVGIVAVLGQRVVATVAVLVSAPVVGVLRRGLAPGEVVAVVLGAVGTHIAGGPQQAARQAEIDVVVYMTLATEVDRGRLCHVHEEALHRGHGAPVNRLQLAFLVIHHDGHGHKLIIAVKAVDVGIVGEGVAQECPPVGRVARSFGVVDGIAHGEFVGDAKRDACQRKFD